MYKKLLAILVSSTFAGSVIPARSFAQTGGAVSKADMEKAERIVVEAKADFKAQRFDAAAEKYSVAYAICKKPTLLFNAARAKQMAGKYTDARMLFVAYKTLPGVKADGSKEADEHIAECDRELEKIEAAKVPRPPIVEPIKGVAPLSVEATKSAADDERTVPAGFTFESNKLVSWQSGAALVLLGSGIGLMAHGAGRMTDANNMVVATQADKAAYHDEFSSAHTEWVVGIASCALGAGATYWALTKAVTFGGSATKPAATVQIIPSFGGFTLAGVF